MQIINAYPSVPEKTGPKIPCEARGHTLQEMPLANGDAQRGAHDVDHRLGHPAEDQAVHQHAQIDGAKPAQKRGGLAGIAHLRELHVGHQARAPPQAREQETPSSFRKAETPTRSSFRKFPACKPAPRPAKACPPRTWWPPSKCPPATRIRCVPIRNNLRNFCRRSAENTVPAGE